MIGRSLTVAVLRPSWIIDETRFSATVPSWYDRHRETGLSRKAGQKLVKNTLVFDLKRSAADVWVIGPLAADLEKNTLASSQLVDFAAPWRDRRLSRQHLEKNIVMVFCSSRPYNRSCHAHAGSDQHHSSPARCREVVAAQDRRAPSHQPADHRQVSRNASSPPTRRDRASKLDPFKPAIAELLEQDAAAQAPVVTQRLRTLGYDGGETIVKDYLRALRAESKARRAYVRVEPGPGERFDIDWGHFGALTYNGASRKLYAFCLVEATAAGCIWNSLTARRFETFVRCHIHAFDDFGGCARELWFDNLATAVAEHEGNLVRFNPRFLGFAREYGFIPRACHVAAAWEKGKVERAIGYVRQNFWPLRTFTDLADVNAQARHWVRDIANQRKHRETGQAPAERFQQEFLRPFRCWRPTIAIRPRRWFTKTCA